jgi:hypothetical protein
MHELIEVVQIGEIRLEFLKVPGMAVPAAGHIRQQSAEDVRCHIVDIPSGTRRRQKPIPGRKPPKHLHSDSSHVRELVIEENGRQSRLGHRALLAGNGSWIA